MPLAAVLASRGFRVIGVDHDEQRIAQLNSEPREYTEPSLSALLRASGGRWSATNSIRDAVVETDATFVVVDTPRTNQSAISSENVCQATTEAGRALAGKDSRHLLVLVSTAYPGSVMGRVIPSLEQGDKICGRDFDFCYSPEFVALGSVVSGFLQPDFTLVGEFDSRAGDRLQAIYEQMYGQRTVHIRMNVPSAEIAKLALNFCLVAKISCANFFAQLCEKVPGANIDHITRLLLADRRLGEGFLRGGMPYGGKCFPRDVEALISMESWLDVDAGLPRAMASTNERRFEELLRFVVVQAKARGDARRLAIAVLGLSFKADTDETAGSAGLRLVEALRQMDFAIFVHDPAVRFDFCEPVQQVADASACLRAGDVVVIATPWTDYVSLPPPLFTGKRVVDGWRILTESQKAACETYTALGVGPR